MSIIDEIEYIEELKQAEKNRNKVIEKARKRAKEHYYKYKEQHIKATKLWKENNPDKVKEYERKRYEKRKHLKEENEKLHSIIKEVREKVKETKISSQEVENEWAIDICNIVLEILDKVGDIK